MVLQYTRLYTLQKKHTQDTPFQVITVHCIYNYNNNKTEQCNLYRILVHSYMYVGTYPYTDIGVMPFLGCTAYNVYKKNTFPGMGKLFKQQHIKKVGVIKT